MPATADEPLLTPATYQVLTRVPAEWCNEVRTLRMIALRLDVSRASVRKRLDYLRRLGLVERRRPLTIAPEIEIRRVGKE